MHSSAIISLPAPRRWLAGPRSTGCERSRRASDSLVDRIVSHQHEEGWYLEYEGADPGYQSLATYYLADVAMIGSADGLMDSLERSTEFLARCVHPDGSFGGHYGSRNTRFYVPGGFHLLAPYSTTAAAIARRMAASVAAQSVVTLSALDAPNRSPVFNSYCLAATTPIPTSATGQLLPSDGGAEERVVLPGAGLLIDKGSRHYTIVSMNKGGVVQHYVDGRQAIVDCGAVYRDRRGRIGSTQAYDVTPDWRLDGEHLEITSSVSTALTETPSPLQFAVLRLAAITVLRSRTVREWVKRRLVSRLITRPSLWETDQRTRRLPRCRSCRERPRGGGRRCDPRRPSWPVYGHPHGEPGILAGSGRASIVIPRFHVPFERRELRRLLLPASASVTEFEKAFASKFGAADAVAFSYGRTAQWAFLQAVDLADAEVVMPAYTCSVVAHAVALSGNVPVFVDISLSDYNATAERMAAAITPRTRAVIATNTFGYPQDGAGIRVAVADAENRFGHKIWFIEDCAHAFGASMGGQPIAHQGDVALFGLNVSKIISSIFGGMLTFDDVDLAARVRHWRDDVIVPSGRGREACQRLYGIAAMGALSRAGVSATMALASRTRLLDRWVSAYHLDDEIAFPPDHGVAMTRIGATIGIEQLERYDAIIARRRRNAELYDRELIIDGVKAPLVDGATYSHYVVRVEDRAATVRRWRQGGVQLGELIQYSVPHLRSYLGPGAPGFANSLHASRHLVNIPVDVRPELAEAVVERSQGLR